MAKRAFSYVRFSKPEQLKGDSLRRQLEWGESLCKTKGWTLDESLQLQDKGRSAFRGKHAATGKLAAFLKAIESGDVKPGDVLIVESLDRLSREQVRAALNRFLSIIEAGVEIYTRDPERHYTPESTNDVVGLVEPLIIMSRAHEESSTKSMRGREYWKKMRGDLTNGEKPKPIHNHLPAWLRLSEDRQQFEVRTEAVRAIKIIYRWAGEGMGSNAITARLNKEGVKPIGKRDSWRSSYVAKLLLDRSVIGEYQPHVMKDGKRGPHGEPIPHYFPQLITEEQWYAVRHAVKGRGRTRGRNGPSIANLFKGLIRDARDGKMLHLAYAGSPRVGNARILRSYGCRNGESDSLSFPYDPVEVAFLHYVRELKPSDIIGDNRDDTDNQIIVLKSKMEELQEKIDTMQKRIMREPEVDALVSLLVNLDAERKAISTQLERLKAKAAHHQPDSLTSIHSLIELLAKVKGDERQELRLKVRAKIAQLIAEMWMIVWDVTPTIRSAELQILFHTGRLRSLLFTWKRRGHGRGSLICTSIVVKEGGDSKEMPQLRNYREDAETRQFFERAQATLNPGCINAIELEVKANDAIKKLEDWKKRKGEGNEGTEFAPEEDNHSV